MTPRILFIVPLPPPVHGSAMMCQYIHDSKLINESFRCEYVNLSTSRRMDEIGKQSLAKVFRFIGSYFIVLWHLLRHRYAACYLAITCHGIGFLKDAPFVLLCKLFGCKVIIHQHNKGMARDVDRWLYRWLLPLVYRNTTVILLSWKLYSDIERVVKREQVVICPNGIPDIEVQPRTHYNPVPHLLFLSNLIESKGVIDLLDACRILKERGYRFVCNFVGSETAEINAERFQREVHSRGLDQALYYLGCKYDKDTFAELVSSNAFIFPTFNEAFGLVLLEAMRQYLPVVPTDERGTSDIVEDGKIGYIAENKSPKDLADKISTLLDGPTAAQLMGQEGRKRFEKFYTIGKYEEAIKEIIAEINKLGVNYANYFGRRYGNEKSVIFATSDIFVFPTFYANECFPLVLLEAMMHSLPIVSTNEGGISDIVENAVTGLIARKQSPEDLADKISHLLDNPTSAREMGREGRKRYLELFTINKYEDRIKKILENALNGKTLSKQH